MDSSLLSNTTLILRIKNEALGSGLLEAFLESAPQFILQLFIILSTGQISKNFFTENLLLVKLLLGATIKDTPCPPKVSDMNTLVDSL